jgi:hypothetical protein
MLTAQSIPNTFFSSYSKEIEAKFISIKAIGSHFERADCLPILDFGSQRTCKEFLCNSSLESVPLVPAVKKTIGGDQPQSWHRMRGPDGSRLFSFSTSRSRTTDDLPASFNIAADSCLRIAF